MDMDNLEPPLFVDCPALQIVGLAETYTPETSVQIPAQWQKFSPWIGRVPGQIGGATYGAICNADDGKSFVYWCGVEIADFSAVPSELGALTIDPAHYAVFAHRGHLSTLRQTFFAIYNKWFPESQWRIAKGAKFEKYGPEFNPRTGTGMLEIWIPVQPR
jgi:AraC family transcriptional regulator